MNQMATVANPAQRGVGGRRAGLANRARGALALSAACNCARHDDGAAAGQPTGRERWTIRSRRTASRPSAEPGGPQPVADRRWRARSRSASQQHERLRGRLPWLLPRRAPTRLRTQAPTAAAASSRRRRRLRPSRADFRAKKETVTAKVALEPNAAPCLELRAVPDAASFAKVTDPYEI